ncbi:substrate-binding domain-containing protein [Streptomyces sp. NBC_01361]|uniref:substrate-binding domain-containing protein n=1 Tax=Streptomyces sp. NBC_01361 TaxID=2903838 RepID=UPI002E342657|nr:substrate-binding domain-containing protein [Streptomyces sp. NBC_01361]
MPHDVFEERLLRRAELQRHTGPRHTPSGRCSSDAAAAFGVEVTVIPCGHTARHGYDAAGAVRALDVTAVVAYNDLVARGAASALEESGLRVPDDMAVIGCDDISPLDDLPGSRRLTTVSMARDDLGRQAAETLEALMTASGDTEPRRIPLELRVRETSAAPSTRSR